VTVADRDMVEEKADVMLSEAQHSDVAFLVVGDPFGYICLPLSRSLFFNQCSSFIEILWFMMCCEFKVSPLTALSVVGLVFQDRLPKVLLFAFFLGTLKQ